MSNPFGWSYPPGVSSTPFDEHEPPCVECPLYREQGEFEGDGGELGGCIIGPHEADGSEINRCPIHNLIENCPVCGGDIGRVYDDIPKEHFGDGGWSGEAVPCCSVECKKKQDIVGKAEIDGMLAGVY